MKAVKGFFVLLIRILLFRVFFIVVVLCIGGIGWRGMINLESYVIIKLLTI